MISRTMNRATRLACLALLLCGCAARVKHWAPIGGSRSDGVVKLAYEQHGVRRIKISNQEAQQIAEDRCARWGYRSASAFSDLSTCTGRSAFGCTDWLVTREYQCEDAH